MLSQILLVAGFCIVASTAAAATLNWFTPDAFKVTCQLQQRCVVNEACTRISSTLSIDHDRNGEFTRFILPDGKQAQGALGVISDGASQTLVATASEGTSRVHRISIFPDAAITISVAHFLDRPEDAVLYGTCLPPES